MARRADGDGSIGGDGEEEVVVVAAVAAASAAAAVMMGSRFLCLRAGVSGLEAEEEDGILEWGSTRERGRMSDCCCCCCCCC